MNITRPRRTEEAHFNTIKSRNRIILSRILIGMCTKARKGV